MSGFNGRKMTINFDGTVLQGIRTRGFTINDEPVDVTSDDDDGWRRLLPEGGVRSMEIPFSGVTKDEVLIGEIMTAGRTSLKTTVVNLATGTAAGVGTPGTLSCESFLASVEVTGEHDGFVEFTGTMQSSGAITYTPTA